MKLFTPSQAAALGLFLTTLVILPLLQINPAFAQTQDEDLPNNLPNPPVAENFEPGVFDNPPGPMNCDDERQNCSYEPTNLPANDIIEHVQDQVFQGKFMTIADEFGFLKTDRGGKLLMQVNSKENVEQYRLAKALIPSLDRNYLPTKRPWIKLEVNAYAISEEVMSGFRVALESVSNVKGDAESGFSITNPNADSNSLLQNVFMNMGLNQIKATMRFGKSQGKVFAMDHIERFVPSHSSISYQGIKNVELPQGGAGGGLPSKSLQIGFSIDGEASILGGPKNPIKVSGLKINYSTQVSSNIADGYHEDSFSTVLIVDPGVEFGTVSAKKTMVITESGYGMGFGREKKILERHVLFTVRAAPFTYDEMMNQSRLIDAKQFATRFNTKEVSELPDSLDTKGAYMREEVSPYLRTFSSGDLMFGFKLNPHFASKRNIKNTVRLKITGLGATINEVRTLESLMVGQGYRIPHFISPARINLKNPQVKISLHDLTEKLKSESKWTLHPFTEEVTPSL